MTSNSQSALLKKQKNTCLSCLTRLSCLSCFKGKKVVLKGKKIWSELFKGINKNSSETDETHFQEIFQVLIDMHNGNDFIKKLSECRANPDFKPNSYIRNDLEYYIPQLINFMIFHEEIMCKVLRQFMLEVSKKDFYFGHRYYWYLNSLIFDEKIQEEEIKILRELEEECDLNEEGNIFLASYAKFASNKSKFNNSIDSKEGYLFLDVDLGYINQVQNIELANIDKEEINRKIQAEKVIKEYITINETPSWSLTNFQLKASDIQLNNYLKFFPKENNTYIMSDKDNQVQSDGFTSTIHFFDDLRKACEKVSVLNDKLTVLKQYLNEINKNLPACVYVPFSRDYLRNSAILHIVVEESKVFSTKERAPCYICLEIYRPEEELESELQKLTDETDSNESTKGGLFNEVLKKTTQRISINFGEPKENTYPTRVQTRITEIISKPITLNQNVDILTTHDDTPTDRHLIDNNNGGIYQTMKHTPDSVKSQILDDSINLGMDEMKLHPRKISKGENENFGISMIYNESLPNQIPINFENPTESILSGVIHSKQRPSMEEPFITQSAINTNTLSRKDISSFVETDIESINNGLDPFFGEDSTHQKKKIMELSPFSRLKSWRLSHVIIKVGADLKEEQFAIQLISQFDQLFKKEKSKLILTPYEIISLGPDFGLVEMIKDAATISSIKENCYKKGLKTLSQFFTYHFPKEKLETAKKNFARSLAAYSLVCYFLQIKDRHNGNILLKKDGSIVHIDFGFFLTNSPGRGLELERSVPFKLMNEYVEVLGGTRSSLFQYFRKNIANGFKIARKHKEEILILVKMMYSAHGENLPCFKGSERSIQELEERFSPTGVNLNTDQDIYLYCQELINQSLDNWRAKCYDKYQYFVQGIFYQYFMK